MSTENALLTILVEKIKNDSIVLPTLPAIALKVRKAADNPNINLNQMGDIIGQDPSQVPELSKFLTVLIWVGQLRCRRSLRLSLGLV